MQTKVKTGMRHSVNGTMSQFLNVKIVAIIFVILLFFMLFVICYVICFYIPKFVLKTGTWEEIFTINKGYIAGKILFFHK